MNICILIFFHMHNDLSIFINRGLMYDLPPQCVTRLTSFFPISNLIMLQTNKMSEYVLFFYRTFFCVMFDRDLKVNSSQDLNLHNKLAFVRWLGMVPLSWWTLPAVQSLLKRAPIPQVATLESREVRSLQRKLSNYTIDFHLTSKLFLPKTVSSCTISDPVLQNKTRIRVNSLPPLSLEMAGKFY